VVGRRRKTQTPWLPLEHKKEALEDLKLTTDLRVISRKISAFFQPKKLRKLFIFVNFETDPHGNGRKKPSFFAELVYMIVYIGIYHG
jgi:adenylate cyclase